MPILDNFDSQFISNVTEFENGLMSPYDKIKLDGIHLDDLDYINNELQNVKDYMVPQFIYGIKIDPAIKDPNNCVVYTDNCSGYIPLKVDQTTGICNYGSWKDIIENIFGVKPYLVKNNGETIFKLDPNNYAKTIDGNSIDIESGQFGQVMIRFKRLYYKFSVDQGKILFQISNKQVDNTWVDTAFLSEGGIGDSKEEMFIGAYECIQKNNILQSLSNGSPSINLTFENFENLSRFGVFNMMNIVRKQFIIFLGYLVTKSIDLEGNIGTGNTTGPILKTGSMNDKGLFFGKNNKTEGVKLFGIENMWGNQLKYMHGIIQKMTYVINTETNEMVEEQHIYTKDFYPYNEIDDYNDIGKIIPELYGYISSIKFITDSIYVPDKLNGTSTDYFKSYFQNGKSTSVDNILYGIYGGNTDYEDKIGSEFLLLANLDNQNIEVTTHLIY